MNQVGGCAIEFILEIVLTLVWEILLHGACAIREGGVVHLNAPARCVFNTAT